MDISESIRDRLTEALMEGDDEAAESISQEILEAEIDPLAIIQDVMTPALTKLGRQFANGEVFLPELLMAADVAEIVSKHMEKAILESGKQLKTLGIVVLGTVKGDIHEIGKNIVATMLRAHGFEVINLGRDVSPSAFLDAAQRHEPDIVGMSSLMTTTRPYTDGTIKLFDEVGVRNQYQMIVGGGSVTKEYAAEIGADGWAPDALETVKLCKAMLNMASV